MKSGEKGGALFLVIFLGAIGLGFSDWMLRMEGIQQKRLKNEKQRDIRRQAFRQIEELLQDPKVLRYASQLPSNLPLRQCLGLTSSSLCEAHRRFPLESQNPFCQGKDCRLTVGEEILGMNLKREWGPLGKDYPFHVMGWLEAKCPENSTSCEKASHLACGITVLHKPEGALGKRGPWGKYETKTLNWIPTTVMEEKPCNPGAFPVSVDNGYLSCQCRYPFLPQKKDGVLVKNEKGILCQKESQVCPSGTYIQGWDTLRQPICLQPETESYTYTQRAPSQEPSQIDCRYLNPRQVETFTGGWISQLDYQCSSYLKMQEKSGKGFDWNTLILGGLFGAGGGLITGAILGSITGVGFLAFPALLAAGLILGYIFGQSRQWHIEPVSPIGCLAPQGGDRVKCPLIQCEIIAQCRAFR